MTVGGETGGKWLGGLQRVLRAALLNPFVRHRLCGLVSACAPPTSTTCAT